MHYKETEYGFEYGAAKISRLFSDEEKGWVTLSLETPKYPGHKAIQIYITKTGKVRISSNGEWKLPSIKDALRISRIEQTENESARRRNRICDLGAELGCQHQIVKDLKAEIKELKKGRPKFHQNKIK